MKHKYCSFIMILAAWIAIVPWPATVAFSEDMVELKFELPQPYWGGPPFSFWGPNLEPESFRPRVPFKAPAGTTLISKGKPVTASANPASGQLKQVTDGDKEYGKKSVLELPTGTQWVQVDLEVEKEINAILLWHWHEGKRIYFDIIVQASNDATFKEGVTTIYNNDYDNTSGFGKGVDKDYIENYQGRLMEANGIKARYVRFYSKGNSANENNNYIEAEIWGK